LLLLHRLTLGYSLTVLHLLYLLAFYLRTGLCLRSFYLPPLQLRTRVLGPRANRLPLLSLRLPSSRVPYPFPLGFLCGFASGLLLSARSPLLSAIHLSLITNRFSLLLLKLPRLSLSFFIPSCRFGVKPFYLLFAYLLFLSPTLVGPLRCLAIIPNIPSIPYELLVSTLIGNAFHAHRLGQVPSKPRLPNFAAYVDWCLPKFLRNARGQIDLAAAPCRTHYCVSERGQCQRIER
jgi:hypothetical protein